MNKLMILGFTFITVLFSQCKKAGYQNNDEALLCNVDCLPDVADKYIYPILPGTEDWQNLNSIEDIYKICQLPDEKLKTISTYGLIRSFLDVPFSLTSQFMVSSSAPLPTWGSIYSRWNSIKELFIRENGAKSLISYYNCVRFDCLNAYNTPQRMTFSVQITALEYLFTRQEILKQLTLQQKKDLVASLLNKYIILQTTQYDGAIMSGSLPAMALIMYDEQYPPLIKYYGSNNSRLVNSGYVFEEDTSAIISFAKSFIK